MPISTDPVPQDKPWFSKADWVKQHQSMRPAQNVEDAQIVFLGDSITQGWLGTGKQTWLRSYQPRRALSLGIGGDETQHVLWRLQNGALDGLSPKVVVLLIGTNNLGNSGQTAEQTIAGIELIVSKIRQALPHSKMLLLGVFPRDAQPNTTKRNDIATINRAIAKLADGKMIFFHDIGDSFLSKDGTISPDVMPDALHLSPLGYEIWASAIEGPLSDLLIG